MWSWLLGYLFRLVKRPSCCKVVACCIIILLLSFFFLLQESANLHFCFCWGMQKLHHSTFCFSLLCQNRLKRPLGCEPTDGLIKCRATELIQPIAFINLTFHCCRTRWNSCFIIFLLAVLTSPRRPSHPIAMLNTLLSASWNPLSMPF